MNNAARDPPKPKPTSTRSEERRIGEIKLAKDVDPAKYGSVSMPCDGRALNVNEYAALYSLIGTKFGGDGKTSFKIPDLTGKSPIEGAQYYIVINGIYPSAN
jgi:microcystin-dependent protein